MANLDQEVRRIQEDVLNAMREIHETHGVPLQLGFVLGLLLSCCSLVRLSEQIKEQENLTERRKLINAFKRRKQKLEESVAFLRAETARVRRENEGRMPRLRRAARS